MPSLRAETAQPELSDGHEGAFLFESRGAFRKGIELNIGALPFLDTTLSIALEFGAECILNMPTSTSPNEAVGPVMAVIREDIDAIDPRPPDFYAEIEWRLFRWLSMIDRSTGEVRPALRRLATWRNPIYPNTAIPTAIFEASPEEIYRFRMGIAETRFHDYAYRWDEICERAPVVAGANGEVIPDEAWIADSLYREIRFNFLPDALDAIGDLILDSGARGAEALRQFDERANSLMHDTWEHKWDRYLSRVAIRSEEFDETRHAATRVREELERIVWAIEVEEATPKQADALNSAAVLEDVSETERQTPPNAASPKEPCYTPRRGPERDYARAATIVRIADETFQGTAIGAARFDDFCEALDRQGVRPPRGWRSWTDKLYGDDGAEAVRKALYDARRSTRNRK